MLSSRMATLSSGNAWPPARGHPSRGCVPVSSSEVTRSSNRTHATSIICTSYTTASRFTASSTQRTQRNGSDPLYSTSQVCNQLAELPAQHHQSSPQLKQLMKRLIVDQVLQGGCQHRQLLEAQSLLLRGRSCCANFLWQSRAQAP